MHAEANLFQRKLIDSDQSRRVFFKSLRNKLKNQSTFQRSARKNEYCRSDFPIAGLASRESRAFDLAPHGQAPTIFFQPAALGSSKLDSPSGSQKRQVLLLPVTLFFGINH